MEIYNRSITAEYPQTDMELGHISIQNYSYRKIGTVIQCSIWNQNNAQKQNLMFTENDFVNMMMEKEEGEYIYPETAEALEKNGGDVNEAFEDETLHRDEVEEAIRGCGRINFRISWNELQEYMHSNQSVGRNEAINILVNAKKEFQLAPMPTQRDMPQQEAA